MAAHLARVAQIGDAPAVEVVLGLALSAGHDDLGRDIHRSWEGLPDDPKAAYGRVLLECRDMVARGDGADWARTCRATGRPPVTLGAPASRARGVAAPRPQNAVYFFSVAALTNWPFTTLRMALEPAPSRFSSMVTSPATPW